MLTEATDYDFERGLGQARFGGREVSDVQCTDIPWLHIEAKHHKRTSIKKAMEQAIADTKGLGQRPVAITKDNYSDILVTMRLEDFYFFLNAALKD